MAYQAELINKLSQFGRTEFDVLITDDAGVLPDMRLSITIPKPFENITHDDVVAAKAELRARAIQIRDAYVAEQAARAAYLTKLNNVIAYMTTQQTNVNGAAAKAAYQVAIDLLNKETLNWQP